MENVPTIISAKFRANFDALLNELSALGYRHEYGILNARDCGIPQSRRRAFVVSKLSAPAPKLPAPILLKTRMEHYLTPIPPNNYYLTEKQLIKMATLNENNAKKGVGYRFEPKRADSIAKTITTREGPREYSNFLLEDSPDLI